MDFIISKDEFQREFKKIEMEYSKKSLEYSRKITYCQEVLELYRREVREHVFFDPLSEVRFFKEHKQIPQTYLVYYLQLQKYEMELQGTGEAFLAEYSKTKSGEIRSFLSSHLEFVQYIELEHIHLDQYYFTRQYRDRSFPTERCYNRDPYFSTSHDLLLSEIKACQLLLSSLQFELRRHNNHLDEPVGKKLQWTSSKVNLIELGYALHLSGAINNGNISLKEFMASLGRFFQTELGNYHHTFLRSRGRLNPFKFLDRLRDNLNDRMQDLDD